MSVQMVTGIALAQAMQAAALADSWLGQKTNVYTLTRGHSGTFDAEALRGKGVVIAPDTERNPFPPVSRNAQKIIRVTVYAYAKDFQTPAGLDAVGDLIDRCESFFDNNLLTGFLGDYEGWLRKAHALDKLYPPPQDLNYFLNEARLTLEYLSLNPALA